MRIFLTGGSGYLGAPLTSALVGAGHEVIALARSEASSRVVSGLGARPFAGDLGDLDPIVQEGAGCDVFLHLAQDRGPERYRTDARLVARLGRGEDAAFRLRHIVYTSTLFVLGDVPGEPADERAEPDPSPSLAPRAAVEEQVLGLARPALATTVVRPGMVYGGGEGGSVGELFRTAVEGGAAVYVGNGRNRWSLIHLSDLARLFLAVIGERAQGLVHAVDGWPLPVLEVARSASRAAGRDGAVEAVPVEEARRDLGAFAEALVLDQPAVTRRGEELGWAPRWPPFDEAAPAAFEEWRRSTSATG